MKTASPLRCAIYTRVSTEHGLEQEFNSLDNQREAAEAYVKSQSHEGWRCLSGRYDDGGFSGGSLERPALQRLLTEIQAKRIDVVVVYKVDRLTRSLADFAKLVELFDASGVSFVSVTQAFNTTNRGSKRYRYYVSGALQRGKPSAASIRRISAPEIEAAIFTAIANATGSDLSGPALVEQHLRQVTIRPDMLEIELSDDRLLQIDWTSTPSRRCREIVAPADASPAIRPMKVEDRERILKAVGQGRAWLADLTDGLIASPDVIAKREAISDRTVRNTIAMALLSPTVVSAIVDGRLPRGICIARLAELPTAWSEQHAALGI